MNLTPDTMQTIFVAFNTYLQRGLGGGWMDWTKFCNVINSSASIEKYPESIISGGMREWVGERLVNQPGGNMLEVLNKDYENTQGVNRNDIEDDALGFYEALFTDMGINAANLWPELVAQALAANPKWADGSNFFSSSRKLGKATINNIVSGALSVSTYETARTQMMGFQKADKTPLALVPNILMVGPSLEKTARQILKAELIAENNVAVSNVHKDEAEVLVNPFLVGTSASMWFLMCTTRGIKPAVVQKRKEGALQRWDKDSDVCVKENNRNDYGIHYRGAAALVAPQLIVGGNLS